MAKRRTKAQKEAEEKAALKQRVDDMIAGACGFERADQELGATLNYDQLGNVIEAIHYRLFDRAEEFKFIRQPHHLGRYSDIDLLVDWLYEHGARA